MPTETTAQRLIDANAFKKVLRELANTTDHPDEFNGIESCIRKLESAPTVETTDDGWNLLSDKSPEHPGKYLVELDNGLDDNFQVFNWTSKDAWEKWPVKRWKKLEVSLNSK